MANHWDLVTRTSSF